MHERRVEQATGTSFNELLFEVASIVGGDDSSMSNLDLPLEKIRKFFHFGNAFIYEHDPMRQFILKEHSSVFRKDDLPKTFDLEKVLSAEQIESLKENPLSYADQFFKTNTLREYLAARIKAKSFFAIFLTDNMGAIVGCVGLADDRQHESFSDEEFIQVTTLVKLLGERVRFRICQHRLLYTNATLENIMDHTGFDIYVNDYHTHEMLYANKSMAAPYGGWENMKGKTCFKALYDDKDSECEYCPKQHLIDKDGNPSKIYSWDYQRPFDGTWFRVLSAAFEWTDGRLAQVISSANIHEAKQNELLIEHMAFFDMLTGIGNRHKLEHDIKELIASPQVNPKGFLILFADLNAFKPINDTYGHTVGDELLKHLANVFQKSALTKDACYRYGGDEFIFLFENADEEDAPTKVKEIESLLGEPFKIQDTIIRCTGGIGYAHYPEDGDDYWSLLDKADKAMYDQKNSRR